MRIPMVLVAASIITLIVPSLATLRLAPDPKGESSAEVTTSNNAPSMQLGRRSSASGIIVGWGDDEYGQVSGAPSGNNFVRVAAGFGFSAAIDADGDLYTWGRSSYGLNAGPLISGSPAPYTYTEVSCGYDHGVALTSDYKLVTWGNHCSGSPGAYSPYNNDPPNETNVTYTAVAAGENFSLALRADGSILAWGGDGYGALNAPSGTGFEAIAAGAHFGMALKNGTVYVWGGDTHTGECNCTGHTPPTSIPTDLLQVYSIGAGHCTAYAITCDPDVYPDEAVARAWGGCLQCGQRDIPSGEVFVGIHGGYAHGVGQRIDGTIRAWGATDNYAPACLSFLRQQQAPVPDDWETSVFLDFSRGNSNTHMLGIVEDQ